MKYDKGDIYYDGRKEEIELAENNYKKY